MNPLRVAFAGTFAARLAEPVQAHLSIPCDVIIDDEREIVSRLREIDVLVTLAFTREMGGPARARLRHDSRRDQTRRFSPGPSGRACPRARRSRGRTDAS